MESKRPEKFLRVEIVAERLDVSKSLIYSRINSGALRYVKHGKRKGIRIPESAVDEYMNRLQNGAGED